jgi:hypothetical protein
MSSNRPSPLSLKVRSKFAELFLLKREEAINISKSYSNIWKKLYVKEFHNLRTIKEHTFKVLRKYIEINQLLINLNMDETINNNMDITMNDLNALKKTILNIKKRESIKYSLIRPNDKNKPINYRNKKLSIDKGNLFEKNIFENKHSFINFNINHQKNIGKTTNIFGLNEDINKKAKSDELFKNLLNKQKDKTKLFIKDNNYKKNEKIKKLKNFLLNLKHKLLRRKIKNDYNYNKSKSNKRNSLINFNKIIDHKYSNSKNLNINTAASTKDLFSINLMNNSANKSINNDSLIKDLYNYYNEENNFSFFSINQEKKFKNNNLAISNNISIHILSSYTNLNKISKGKYINDKKFQKEIKNRFKKKYSSDGSSDYSLSLNLSSDLEFGSNSNKNKSNKSKKKKINVVKIKKTKSERKDKNNGIISNYLMLNNSESNQFLSNQEINKNFTFCSKSIENNESKSINNNDISKNNNIKMNIKSDNHIERLENKEKFLLKSTKKKKKKN